MVICLSAVSQDAVFFVFKIVGGGGDFISAWKVWVVLIVALHFFAVLGIILKWYGPKGCERIV
jgi:hypothetical protein